MSQWASGGRGRLLDTPRIQRTRGVAFEKLTTPAAEEAAAAVEVAVAARAESHGNSSSSSSSCSSRNAVLKRKTTFDNFSGRVTLKSDREKSGRACCHRGSSSCSKDDGSSCHRGSSSCSKGDSSSCSSSSSWSKVDGSSCSSSSSWSKGDSSSCSSSSWSKGDGSSCSSISSSWSKVDGSSCSSISSSWSKGDGSICSCSSWSNADSDSSRSSCISSSCSNADGNSSRRSSSSCSNADGNSSRGSSSSCSNADGNRIRRSCISSNTSSCGNAESVSCSSSCSKRHVRHGEIRTAFNHKSVVRNEAIITRIIATIIATISASIISGVIPSGLKGSGGIIGSDAVGIIVDSGVGKLIRITPSVNKIVTAATTSLAAVWASVILAGATRPRPLATFVAFALTCASLSSCSTPEPGRHRLLVLTPSASCEPSSSSSTLDVFPEQAVRLATSRLNRDPGYTGPRLEVTVVPESCDAAQALEDLCATLVSADPRNSSIVGPTHPGHCEAAVALATLHGVPIAPLNCQPDPWTLTLSETGSIPASGGNDSAPRASTSPQTPPLLPLVVSATPPSAEVLLLLLRHFGWAHTAVVAADTAPWRAVAAQLAAALRRLGVPVGVVARAGAWEESARQALSLIQRAQKIKLVIMCMSSSLLGGAEERVLLQTAARLGLTRGSHVFVPLEPMLCSLGHGPLETYPRLADDPALRQAYDATLTLSLLSSPNASFRDAVRDARSRGEMPQGAEAREISPLFGSVYDAVSLLASALQLGRASDLRADGLSRVLRTDAAGRPVARYAVLDTDGDGDTLSAVLTLDSDTGEVVPVPGSRLHFPGAGAPPAADPECWFDPTRPCAAGVEPSLILLVMVVALCFVLGGVALTFFLRRRIHQLQMVKGPNKILMTLDDLTFINPQQSRKLTDDGRTSVAGRSVTDLKGTARPSRGSVSGKSVTPAPESSSVAVYEGDWVWLKKFPKGKFGEIRQATTSVFRKLRDMRHENVNPLLGIFSDLGVAAVVSEYCLRGSLEDLIRNSDMKLDWMFKSSLLFDLIKGMRYLHHREVVHGRLKSRNCVVDGRFVLKVADHGFNELLESQRIVRDEPSARELLWSAPELLRDAEVARRGTARGDTYSFAIVLQELIVRGAPFCMVDLSAEEIVRKVRKPPPLCRPSVSMDQAPVECIQLMKLCWNELPERRPSFDSIFDQFKSINKGKKTNIIDSMLRMLEQYSSNLEDLIRERTEELEVEKQKTDKLLTQMLPPSVAEALKTGAAVRPEFFDEVTIYFSDIVGFTTISAMSEPIEVVDLLNDLYTLFDAIIGVYDVYKVETIGDAYMVASGLPKRNGKRHAGEISDMSLDILSSVGSFRMRHLPDVPVRIRIGLHTGPCVAGVVGLTMPRYCLFGDTVNTASRMESTGMPCRIHINRSTVTILDSLDKGYKYELRGNTELKGKGVEETYWLVGRQGLNKPLPVPPEMKPGDSAHGINVEEILKYRQKKEMK
ncbi:retinal guanylyl cyclase 1-like isoform X2 [Lampetra fluviatilis]